MPIISEGRVVNQARARTGGTRASRALINSRSRSGRRTESMAPISYDDAYPHVEFLPRSRNWWSWLKGTPAECIHLGEECKWIATLVPDIIFLRGKRGKRHDVVRPDITLCRDCLAETSAPEMAEYEGRVVAFAPDPALLTQYFFVRERRFRRGGACTGRDECNLRAAGAEWRRVPDLRPRGDVAVVPTRSGCEPG